ncbi:Receptor-like serine/threonine-protein kinase NCRK [Acorus calamus]|uniref:Receptor-like serine/threonine-protein kinase NCRK n=1 Tax=Acorus calamus TaxID=4465 RepID=A0AAV9CQR8_ACOCL|nr:Receptor-like serine/threonine-protein kinase NCRK [Acorus calamus]
MEESGMVKWTCVCASQETQTAASAANCSSACDCSPGSPPITKTSRKHISSKAVIVVLMLCVVLTTVAFLASMACYFYRKDRFHVQSSLSSSDKDTSWNSGTNLISHRSTSVSEYREKIYTEVNLFKGLIECASFMFKSRRGTLTGAIIQFSYIELEEATKNFANDNLIGLGGTSNVYRGQLRDGRAVAIKRIKMLSGPDVESGFLTEIELISRLNHCHVVPLIGFCAESRGRHFERLLVFEFMANGNLRDCLDAKQNEPISWWRIGPVDGNVGQMERSLS